MATGERIEINIFWHILLKNHAIEIIREQLRCMKESGLFDRANNIFIGLIVVDFTLLKEFQLIISSIKTNIVAESVNELDYEFLTLDYVYEKCCKENPFYGLYIHTKGVSYPGNEGGKFWLDYMNHYNITRWKEAVDKLDKGYDLFGVNMLTENNIPANRRHYSGNFFWFWSDYISTLTDPKLLDRRNRGEAEMWACSNYPIAATGCQVFVDYNTKGKFEPFKINSNI